VAAIVMDLSKVLGKMAGIRSRPELCTVAHGVLSAVTS
jgi:hypothetical protein